MACQDGGLATPGGGSRPVPIGSQSIGVSLQPAIPRRVAPQQSPLPLHQSPAIVPQIPIRRGNQIARLNLTAGIQSKSPSSCPSPAGCHFYFARRVTFLSCADIACKSRLRGNTTCRFRRRRSHDQKGFRLRSPSKNRASGHLARIARSPSVGGGQRRFCCRWRCGRPDRCFSAKSWMASLSAVRWLTPASAAACFNWSTVCCGSRNATCVNARSLLDIQPVGCRFAM
jgi:hypothetical protein